MIKAGAFKYLMHLAIKAMGGFFFLVFSPLCFSHGSHSSEKQIETSIALFEKAIQLSPELLSGENIIPFYKINGHKIYLNSAFWKLTRAWLELYIQELEVYCPCDLDPDLMIEESKNYVPKSPLLSKASRFSKNTSENLLSLGTHLTAKYGYVAAALKVSAEVAETILSIFVGGKGIHVLCNAIDVMIFPLARKIQKSYRIFSYGSQFSQSRLLFSARMAWLSRRINKSQKRVFFAIDEALEFNLEELEKLNSKGPKSWFHSKGHRLLWLENLKSKTDPLFDQIESLEDDLTEAEEEKEINKIEKKIKKTRAKIESLTQVSRKNFFGQRFKRWLFLRSRKTKVSYMNAPDIKQPFKFIMKKDFWPLGMQYLIESPIEKKNWNQVSFIEKSPKHESNKDEILSMLIEEFLQKVNPEAQSNLTKPAVEFFISDFHNIFDVNQKTELRLVSARSVEILLSHFFSHYLTMSKKKFLKNYEMSFREKMNLHWRFGQIENLSYAFSDFLVSAAISKKEDKIKFYKYESIEKFFSFLLYFNEVNAILKKPHLSPSVFLSQLSEKEQSIKSFSLTKEKRTAVQILPFRKSLPKCRELVEKYQ